MEAGAATAAPVDEISVTTTSPAEAARRWSFAVSQQYQNYLDKSTPYVLYRWIACLCVAIIYIIRVYFVQGFYVVSYAVGIYIINLLIGFLSPQVDPELQNLSDGPTLPTRGSDEFRPFVRRLPEFKFCFLNKTSLFFTYTGRNGYDSKPLPGRRPPEQGCSNQPSTLEIYIDQSRVKLSY